MYQFSYEARDKEGNFVKGEIEAPSEDLAVEALQKRNLVISGLSLSMADPLKKDISIFFNRPNITDTVIFTRQLATIIAADISLIEGLEMIAAQSAKPQFALIVNQMVEAIRGGSSLSLALSAYPHLFSQFYVSLVKSGEISGRMEQVLLYLADYLEKNQALNAKIRGALAYPLFILFALAAVSLLMVTTVLPKLLEVIKESGVEDLPLITKILVGISDFVNNNLFFLLVLLTAGALAFWQYFFRTAVGRERFDRLKINFPQLGSTVQSIYIARFAETFATLIKAGVPILESLQITSEVVGNIIYKKILLEAKENVQNGGSVSEVLGRYPQFPKLVSSMVAIGERTGRTDFMLESVFKFYNFEADQAIQNLSQLIEPVLILILGIGVGLLVAGILLPIFSLVGAA